MKSIAGNDNRRVKQTMLYFKRVGIFRINFSQIEASVMLFDFVVLISQSFENYMFSIFYVCACNFVQIRALKKY